MRLLKTALSSYGVQADVFPQAGDLERSHSEVIAEVFQKRDDYDLIHNFAGAQTLLFGESAPAPVLTTIYGPIRPEAKPVYKRLADCFALTCIHDRMQDPELSFAATIPPGVSGDDLPVNQPEGFVVLAGCKDDSRARRTAARAAQAVGLEVGISLPAMDDKERLDMLSRAGCALVLGDHVDHMALDALEAACMGVPVIAPESSAFSALILPGVTGVIAPSESPLSDAIDAARVLDRNACRLAALEMFSTDAAARHYAELYPKAAHGKLVKNPQAASPPWGRWSVLLDQPTYKVKRIQVLPGKRLSYQKHFKRREHWMIVAGEAVVTLDGKQIPLHTGQYVDIPEQAAHRIHNPDPERIMIFIEVQQGEYFGEDDIIRLEDDFGRA